MHFFPSVAKISMNYIILDGIEGCMRIYCMRHDNIHRAGTAR